MKKIWDWIKNLFKRFTTGFLDLMKEAFPLAKQVIMASLSEFGEQVVAELATGNLNSSEKREEAFKRIGGFAKETGLEVGNSLIYALIEILYQKYKNKEESQ